MLTFDAEKGVIVRDYEEEYNSIISSERFYAREEGREEGIKQGREEGYKIGYKLGFELGMKEVKGLITEKNIQDMKAMGLDDKTIMKALNINEDTLKNFLA